MEVTIVFLTKELPLNSLALADLVDEKDRPIDGLVSVRDLKSTTDLHERSILIQAAEFKHIDYVLFRRFKHTDARDFRASQVAAYVVDNSQQHLTEPKLAELHHKLWLHGVAPLVYVAWPTRIDILTCAREPDFWEDQTGVARYCCAARIEPTTDAASQSENGPHALETAAAISNELQRFSAYRLAEGTFWDEPGNQTLAKENAAAHRTLIAAIVETDNAIDGANRPMLRRMLVLMVLIKYLEDRRVFPRKLFGRFRRGTRSFFQLLETGSVGEVLSLLRYLERKFNGDVFSLGDDANKLTKSDLNRFATFVEGKELGGYRHFWALFSFEHVPVEVISRIYQRFVTGHGAVYTPPLLAALLLDQVMPYGRLTGNEKVLDPACGSGIFLVGAFKRLVVHWSSRHGWRRPSVEVLKRILRNSIHGVELESGAVDLTAFSLSLAICDALKPPVIWNRLKFDKLRGRNLREGDFFDPQTFADSADHEWPKEFDVVVGNPPFESKLTAAAKAVDKARPKNQPKLPDKQSAYLFLEQGLKTLAPGGSLCLIQPHGILYNSNPAEFRRYLMGICCLRTVLDFVSIRGLYEGGDAKTIAWYATNETASDDPINHLTFRRTYSAFEQIAFEIDHYDWHLVTHREAEENPFVWRVALLGGGRLNDVAKRMRSMKTLVSYIGEKGDQWDYGEGFIAGKTGKREPAPFLTGKPLLPTGAFDENGIDRSQLDPESVIVKETLFKSAYTELRYSPPLILLKAHDSLPTEFWDDGFIAYRDKIIGIHAPRSEKTILQAIFQRFNDCRRFYQFCCIVNGSQALTGKSTVPLKQDIDLLPFPDDPSELDLAFWEDALKEDVLNYMADYVRLGQKSDLLRKAAGAYDLAEYSKLFVRMLGSLYRNLQSHDPVFLNGLIAQPFFFGKRPDFSWLGKNCEESLHQLIYDKSREALRTIRVVRYYDENVILIVKPDRLRYWIRSTAIRDADDTLVDLRQQGW